MFDEETESKISELTDELFEGLSTDRDILFFEGGIVRSAPTGAPPEYITVEIENIYDENVMWRGIPPTPAVGDEVVTWENPLTHRREIFGASGAGGVSGGASWCQVVVVAKCGGDFDDITDAIAWINALAAGPAANKLYVLYVLAGNWIEGANIIIPDYVYLVGLNEGTSIELGAFTIIMGDYTGLFNVKITSSDPAYAIDCNGKSNVMLRHVHVTTTSTGGALYVRGASDLEAHDCVFEATANTWTVYVTDTSTVLLNHVIAEGGLGAGGYGLFMAGTCTVTAKWCEFEGYYPIYASAGTTLNHFSCQFDLSASVLVAGTHTALSSKRFNQTLTVAEAGGEFTSLDAAITYINAQADAAAGKLYGVLMLHGNFAEAASIIVPSYVHVMGQGEGTEIEIAATHTLTLSDDSSLQNVVVEGNTDAAEGVVQIASGASNVILRNVRSIQSNGAGYCYYADGDAYSIWFYECRAEGSAGADGFVFEEASAVLDDCEANHGNLANGLLLLHASDVIITRYCAFAGTVDAVNTLAGSAWSHFMCQFDPSNSTIAGTETPLVTGKANFGDVVTFEAAAPLNIFRETDQGLPAGLWRYGFDGDAFLIDQNTAVAGDFSTYVRRLALLASGFLAVNITPPLARIHTVETTVLGGVAGNSQLISTFSGHGGGNEFKQSQWLYRDANGADWTTTRLHDAISIAAAFVTPGVDTKVWWERDPSGNIQSWGNAAATYMTLAAGDLLLGTTTAPTANSGKVLVFGDNANDPTLGADTAAFYGKDVAGNTEAFATNEDESTRAQLTPHNFTLFSPDPSYRCPWSHYAIHPHIGYEIGVDMYGAVKAIEQLAGKQFIYERELSETEKLDWNAQQEVKKQQADALRLAAAMAQEVEIGKLEALEEVEEMEKVPTGKMIKTGRFKLVNGEVVEIEEPEMEELPTGRIVWQLKAEIRFATEDGKFYRTRTEQEAEFEEYIKKEPPQWLKERINNGK